MDAKPTGNYTCNDYREEMILLGLQRRLANPDLSPEEREKILQEIARVEEQMGL
ncbi:MAG: hypothetical protein MI747_06245 [Desulfobacterales bacterium]|nr:hypothetical protein [Desulfobacterales bacterium]